MRTNGVARTLIMALALALPLGCEPPATEKTPAPQQTSDEGPQSDPPGAPLAAKLVARKKTYALDREGRTPEQYRAAAKTKPPVVDVDLVLELRNTGRNKISIWVADDYRKEEGQPGGDYVALRLDLEGPGAVSAAVAKRYTMPMTPPPRARALAPGETYPLPVTTLSYGTHGVARFEAYRACWTQAGEYTLTATFRTAVSPAPPGSEPTEWAHFKGGLVSVTSAPVKLRVVEKGKE